MAHCSALRGQLLLRALDALVPPFLPHREIRRLRRILDGLLLLDSQSYSIASFRRASVSLQLDEDRIL